LERDLLTGLAGLSHKLHLEVYNFTADHAAANAYHIDKVPGFLLIGEKDYGIRYYGMPSDFEFRMLLEDIVHVSSGQSDLSSESVEKLRQVRMPVSLEIITVKACFLSTEAVHIAHRMAIESDLVTVDLVNAEDFPEVAKRYRILASPTVVVNGSYSFYGARQESDFVKEVFKGIREETSKNT
jgi:glutaredoxin-like protein